MLRLKRLFYLVAAAHFFFTICFNLVYIEVPNRPEFSSYHAFGGKWKYLTVWDLIIQCIYFSISFANDIVGTNEFYAKQKPLIRTIKDNLFCCIAFPLATFVSLTFWGLYAIDRELVFPAAMDEYFPTWLNHVVHTNVLIFSVVEFVTTFREYPPRKHGLPALTLFMLVYLIWVFIIYLRSGSWVYPVMQVLNWPARIMFFLSMLFFILGIYISQEILNDKIWSDAKPKPTPRPPIQQQTRPEQTHPGHREKGPHAGPHAGPHTGPHAESSRAPPPASTEPAVEHEQPHHPQTTAPSSSSPSDPVTPLDKQRPPRRKNPLINMKDRRSRSAAKRREAAKAPVRTDVRKK